MTRITALLAILGLSAASVLADALIKHAGRSEAPLRSLALYVGAITYFATAFGWLFVFQRVKLAIAGALFSIVVVVLLAIVDYGAFGIRLTLREGIGLGCALVALALLARF